MRLLSSISWEDDETVVLSSSVEEERKAERLEHIASPSDLVAAPGSSSDRRRGDVESAQYDEHASMARVRRKAAARSSAHRSRAGDVATSDRRLGLLGTIPSHEVRCPLPRHHSQRNKWRRRRNSGRSCRPRGERSESCTIGYQEKARYEGRHRKMTV